MERREGQVILSVADNGCWCAGGSAGDQIFVPFFTTKPGGSGIGLNPRAMSLWAMVGSSMCARIVRAGRCSR